MKIYPRIPRSASDDPCDYPLYIESDVVPRVGEYFSVTIPMQTTGRDEDTEVYYKIVRVAYFYDDENQMEAALVLEKVHGDSLDTILE